MLLRVIFLFFVLSSVVSADPILTAFESTDPTGTWGYFIDVGIGEGNSTTYFPTTQAELANATFAGIVEYPEPLGWLHSDSGFFDEDTLRVFRANITSAIDQSITFRLGIDDGHSLFLDNVFQAGAVGTLNVDIPVSFTAGTPILFEVAGYNGPGPFQLALRRNDGTQIADIPSLTVTPVPEPSTYLLLTFSGLLSLWYYRKTRQSSSNIPQTI